MAVGKKPDWYRGAYLVEVLGYCAECHKLRFPLVELNSDMYLADAIDGLGANSYGTSCPFSGPVSVSDWRAVANCCLA